MYSTCLFCNKPLGANEALELFPVGRRLAFDAAKGRLWVVCRSCERWNLSPIEERWEVIDMCEDMFRQTTMRVSTENIGLARLREGLELVRIGSPLRPEFAAWRYGDQFGRRRRRNAVRAGLSVTAVSAAFAAVGPTVVAGVVFGSSAHNLIKDVFAKPVVLRIRDGDRPITVRRKDLRFITLEPYDRDSWIIQIPYKRDVVIVAGEEAQRAAAHLLPAINRAGGSTRDVQEAVYSLEGFADPLDYVAHAARTSKARMLSYGRMLLKPPIDSLPAPVRLALEMATHEEAERRALEGELRILDLAWRDAEEVAKISDGLLTVD